MCTQSRPALSLHARATCAGRAARAFTVAELMIVLIILGIVLSVILPSIKHVNNRAKAAVTTSILSSLSGVAGGFVNDNNGRNPGYYTAAEMGDTANRDSGLSGLQNILLDLMAGVTVKPATPGTGVYEVWPGGQAEKVRVDLAQLAGTSIATPGGPARSYFRPDPKYYYAAAEQGIAVPQPNQKHLANFEGNQFLPDLHDAFGQPLLGWQEDERANLPGAGFAATETGAFASRFYWVSNACFLRSTALGKLLQNQSTGSMIGDGVGANPEPGEQRKSLNGLLGNPAFPSAGFMPPKARGPLVFHSAGANGIFLGGEERGAKTSVTPGTSNRVPLAYIPGVDPMKNGDFDDIVVSAGN